MRIQQLKLMRIRIQNLERNLVTCCTINSDPLLQEVLQEVPLPALSGRGHAAGTGGRLPQEPITVKAHFLLNQDPDPDWILIESGLRIRIQEAKCEPQKGKKFYFEVLVLDGPLLGLED
jgi:hypothetical protein